MPRAHHGLSDEAIAALHPRPNGRETFHRHGSVPGLRLRVGVRRKTWEWRNGNAARRVLGHWPDVSATEAKRGAEALWERHKAGKPLEEAKKGGETLTSLWPLFEDWLRGKGRSTNTISGYKFGLARLSDDVKNQPLRELAEDPTVMEQEVKGIRRVLSNSKRGGQGAASQAARTVSAMFSFARRRTPALSGNPCSAVSTVDPKRHDLPALAESEMPAWWEAVHEIPREHHRWAHVFTLLSGLRRESLATLEWKNLDLRRRCIRVERVKGGPSRAFDLPLSKAMIRCLWNARRVGRRLFPKNEERWVFAGPMGHVRGDALNKDAVLANHSLRRGFATAATSAGIDEDTIGKLLNHGGRSITSRYIRTSYLGKMLAGAQEDISRHIVGALGSPKELR